MTKGTTGQAEVIRLRQDISCLLRRRVLEAVESVLEEELTQALGTGRYERSEERRGYRNGHETRRDHHGAGPADARGPSRSDRRGRRPHAGVPERGGAALRAAHAQGRRGDPGRVSGRGQYTAHPQGARAIARLGVPVEERGVAGGGAAQDAVRGVERAGSVGGAVRDPVPGRVSPQGADGTPCGERAGAGRARSRARRDEALDGAGGERGGGLPGRGSCRISSDAAWQALC